MSYLAKALVNEGCQVTYVAESLLSKQRASQGWQVPTIDGVELHTARSKEEVKNLVQCAPSNATHICQGIRANGLVSFAQEILRDEMRTQWAVMETVNDHGLKGIVKREVYRKLLASKGKSIDKYLAIGRATPDWLIERGAPANKVHPFAYFLSDEIAPEISCRDDYHSTFKFVFVGRLVSIKRVDLLLKTLASLQHRDFTLTVIGDGPLGPKLKLMASKLLPGRVIWLGQLSITDVPKELQSADALVLPSAHDGWGAVISEALMLGVPVICSDSCGASVVVDASGEGAVFPRNDLNAFKQELELTISKGRSTNSARQRLATWAKCLGAKSGAQYLLRMASPKGIDNRNCNPPWKP